jgi:hypothetical protein
MRKTEKKARAQSIMARTQLRLGYNRAVPIFIQHFNDKSLIQSQFPLTSDRSNNT